MMLAAADNSANRALNRDCCRKISRWSFVLNNKALPYPPALPFSSPCLRIEGKQQLGVAYGSLSL